MSEPTPSEADVKAAFECAKSLGMYDLDWHKDRTERIVEIMEEIISRHMQPERDELERLREEVRMEYTRDGLGLVEENLKLRKERNAAQKEVERLNIDLNVVQPLYEEAEAENDQFRLQLTASRDAMEVAERALQKMWEGDECVWIIDEAITECGKCNGRVYSGVDKSKILHNGYCTQGFIFEALAALEAVLENDLPKAPKSP